MVQSGDKRVLTAATEIVRKGLASVTLLGDPEAVAQDADRLGLDLSGIQVIDHMVRSPLLHSIGCIHCSGIQVIDDMVRFYLLLLVAYDRLHALF